MVRGIVLLILLNIVLLARSIRYKLTVDDEGRTKYKKGQFNKLTTLWRMLRSSGNCNPNLTIDHILSILIHTTTVVLIYIFFNNFMLALLFSLHPVNIQVSTWLNGKRYAISTILVLFMLKTMPYGIIIFPILSFFQINGIMTPILYAMSGYWWVIFAYPILFAFGKDHILRQIANRYQNHAPAGELRNTGHNKLIIGIKTFGFYTTHILLPTKVAFLHTFLDRFGTSNEDNEYWYSINWHFWRGLIMLLTIGTFMFLNWNNHIGKGLFWYLIFIVQWCNYPISITQSVTDRYCYLPMIGLLAVLCQIVPTTYLYVYAGYLLAKHIQTLPMYNGIEGTLTHNSFVYPKHLRIYASKAEHYMKQHLFHNAYGECVLGLRVRKNDFRLLTLGAKCLIFLDKTKYKEPIKELLNRAENNYVLGTEKNCRKQVQLLTDMAENWEGFDYENEQNKEVKNVTVVHLNSVDSIVRKEGELNE